MSDLLARIDAVTAGLCQCGAAPRKGSAYCGPDCEPTHISDDTDERDNGWLSTPMRWRPDLVTEADDTDLIPLGSNAYYGGRYNAQLFERVGRRDVWHLRLDDGHRFVGCDLDGVGDVDDALIRRVGEKWAALERELGNTRHLVDDDDPWADAMRRSFPDPVRALFELSRTRRAAAIAATAAPSGHADSHVHIQMGRQSYHQPRNDHNPQVRAVYVTAPDLQAAGRAVAQSIESMAPAAEAFLREAGFALTEWQRSMVEQMYRLQTVQPRRFGLSAAVQADAARLGFRPLVNAREATVLAQHGLREGLDFLRYADPPPPEPSDPVADPDEPPTDPMQRALWLRKRRNTGPAPDRLDGRRRRRR